MLQNPEKTSIKASINEEKKKVSSYKTYMKNLKQLINQYTLEFNNISLSNKDLTETVLNNFKDEIKKIDKNVKDMESLNKTLNVFKDSSTIKDSDIKLYNKAFSKIFKDMKEIYTSISEVFTLFSNENIKGKKQSLEKLNSYKESILMDFPFVEEKMPIKSEKKSIKKHVDFSSSDLLCYFPKKESDSLLISTIQENYKISFNGNVASIFIDKEDFNISLKTAGVQISNSNTHDVLFVSSCDTGYTIITNMQIEIPPFIQVSRIVSNDNLLEFSVTNSYLNISIENSIITFEEDSSSFGTAQIIDTSNNQFIDNTQYNNKIEIQPNEEPSVAAKSPAWKTKGKGKKDITLDNVSKEIPLSGISFNPNKIKDNDTLIISDANKDVLLPYTVKDLEAKLKKNKKYKSLQDVIENEYMIPADTFKNPAKARFKEAFQLMKKKEHGSLKEALELGFELMFESKLNPAIIAACKDLDELDIYLDCLDDNELENFSCFKIVYNVPPAKK